MDFRELEYFVTIAQEKNLTYAARKLYVTQPALTRYLQKLEAEYQLPLFKWVGKQLKLTYAGERYLQYAHRLLATKKSLETEMADIKRTNTGILRIGMPPSRCTITLPQVLPRFHELYPNVTVELMDKNSNALDEALLNGQIDLVFYNLIHPRKGICSQMLNPEIFYAVFRKDHPIREKVHLLSDGEAALELKDLPNEILLVQNRGQRHGDYIQHELEAAGMADHRIQYSSNAAAVVSLAASGYGIAFLSRSLLSYYRKLYSFDAYRLANLSQSICFAAAWRENNYLPGYAASFIQAVKELEEKLISE